jgi:AmmeMemoRadiSam system protein A
MALLRTAGSGAGDAGSGAGDAGSDAGDAGASVVEALTEEERATLLALARLSLARAVEGLPLPELPDMLPPALAAPRRCFVTLRASRQLRGCIGFAEAKHALAEAVIELARAAALEDFRFRPVEPREVSGLSVEISVLGEPAPMSCEQDLEPGRHGVIVSRGPQRALLLPQVATEQGWDARTLLDHCCLKAGLVSGAWKDGRTEVQLFEAEVFGD